MADSDKEEDYKDLVAAQNRKHKKSGGWQSLGLDHNIFRALNKKGYRVPTPIQRKAIPIILQGKDVVAMARTGSGKTAAFLVPLLQKLKVRSAKSGARALLISPTRELALQTFKFMKELGKYTGLRAAVLVGGDNLEDQFSAVHESPDLIIATPGRLLHVVLEMNLKLSGVQYVVFDEADRLFEMGFADQLRDVLKRLSEDRQTLLFSATLPKILVDFARAGLSQPVLIRLDVDTKISDNLDMNFLSCRDEDKLSAFMYIVRHFLNAEIEQSIIFCATKHHVEYLKDVLEAESFPCSYLYSSMDPIARKINITSFRNRETNLLIATDVAARGVDIPMLDNAVNFHFPPKAKLFIHRVGRVARAGRVGRAFSLICPEEIPYMVDLFLFLGRSIKVANPKTDAPYVARCSVSDVIGSVPQSAIDDEADLIGTIHHNDSDLVGQKKVAENAMKNYIRSRPLASSESIKRVKRDEEGLIKLISTPESFHHPIFSRKADASESQALAERSQVLVGLKNYKPRLTIFEVNTSNKNDEWVQMKRKRRKHEKYLKPRAKEAEGGTTGDTNGESQSADTPAPATSTEIQETFSTVINPKYRDPESKEEQDRQKERKKRKNEKNSLSSNNEPVKKVFVPYRPVDFHSEQGLAVDRSAFEHAAKDAVLDFTADDGTDMQRQDQIKKWDRKKKKFVGGGGNDKLKKIRTDHGTLVPASYKSGRYGRWVKRQKVDQQEDRDDEGGESVGESKAVDWRKKGGRLHRPRNRGSGFNEDAVPKESSNIPGAKGSKKIKQAHRRELKTKEEILKARNKKSRVQSYQQYRQGENTKKRGGSSGRARGGGRGRGKKR